MIRSASMFGFVFCAIFSSGAVAQLDCHSGDNELHLHIGHVMSCWEETPDGAGLLATAEAEAAIALQHAQLAVAESGDLAGIQLHMGHVIHAIDPQLQPDGPGLGYGLILAAEGAIVHISFALESDDAFADREALVADDLDNGDALDEALAELFSETGTVEWSELIVTQVGHANVSVNNATTWATEALAIAQSTIDESRPEQAIANAEMVAGLLVAVIDGLDIDGDGKISVSSGEGGLGHAHAAMAVVMAVEQLGNPAAQPQ